MNHGLLLSQSEILGARGTVSQAPADGFSWMLSQVEFFFPTAHHWYLVEDTAQLIACARLPLPHQIKFILAKLTLRRITHKKRRSVAKPVESGRYLSPNPPHPMSYVSALLSPRGGDCEPSSTVFQSTPATHSAAIALHQMARRHKRPRCRPG